MPHPLVAPSSPTPMGQLAGGEEGWSLPSTRISVGQEYSGIPGVISMGRISTNAIPIGGISLVRQFASLIIKL